MLGELKNTRKYEINGWVGLMKSSFFARCALVVMATCLGSGIGAVSVDEFASALRARLDEQVIVIPLTLQHMNADATFGYSEVQVYMRAQLLQKYPKFPIYVMTAEGLGSHSVDDVVNATLFKCFDGPDSLIVFLEDGNPVNDVRLRNFASKISSTILPPLIIGHCADAETLYHALQDDDDLNTRILSYNNPERKPAAVPVSTLFLDPMLLGMADSFVIPPPPPPCPLLSKAPKGGSPGTKKTKKRRSFAEEACVAPKSAVVAMGGRKPLSRAVSSSVCGEHMPDEARAHYEITKAWLKEQAIPYACCYVTDGGKIVWRKKLKDSERGDAVNLVYLPFELAGNEVILTKLGVKARGSSWADYCHLFCYGCPTKKAFHEVLDSVKSLYHASFKAFSGPELSEEYKESFKKNVEHLEKRKIAKREKRKLRKTGGGDGSAEPVAARS